MLKIQFKISKYALASEIIEAQTKNTKAFPFFNETYWKIWNAHYNDPEFFFIETIHAPWSIQMINLRAIEKGFVKSFTNSLQRTEKIYQEIFKEASFKEIEHETEIYLKKIENEWRKKEQFIQTYIQDVLHIPEQKKTITIYIFHPRLSEGRAYYKDQVVLWGHKELWENYSMIYITHEILHVLLDGICKNREITHALIELAIDNELRIRLNPNDTYFIKNKKYQGHTHQKKLVKKIYPYWKEFLKNNTSILDLEKNLALMYKCEK